MFVVVEASGATDAERRASVLLDVSCVNSDMASNCTHGTAYTCGQTPVAGAEGVCEGGGLRGPSQAARSELQMKRKHAFTTPLALNLRPHQHVHNLEFYDVINYARLTVRA